MFVPRQAEQKLEIGILIGIQIRMSLVVKNDSFRITEIDYQSVISYVIVCELVLLSPGHVCELIKTFLCHVICFVFTLLYRSRSSVIR